MDAFSIGWKIKKIIVVLLSVSLKQFFFLKSIDKARSIVLVPNWQNMKMLIIDYPIFIKKRPSLLTLPGKIFVHKI